MLHATRIKPISDLVLTAGRLTSVNAAGERVAESIAKTTSMAAPEGLPRTERALIKIELSAVGAVQTSWQQLVHAYFRLRDGQWRLVGFERLPER